MASQMQNPVPGSPVPAEVDTTFVYQYDGGVSGDPSNTTLKWECDDSNVEIRHSTTVTGTDGSSQNSIKYVGSTSVSAAITVSSVIGGVTQQLSSDQYNFDIIKISNVHFTGNTSAYAPFSDTIDPAVAANIIGTSVDITDENTDAIDNYTLQLASNGNLSYFDPTNNNAALSPVNGIYNLTSGPTGTASVNVGSTNAGTFWLSFARGSGGVEQTVNMIFIEQGGNGPLPALSVPESNGTTIDLDQSSGPTFAVQALIPSGMVDGNSAACVLIDDQVALRDITVTDLAAGVNVPKAKLTTTDTNPGHQNILRYMVTSATGNTTQSGVLALYATGNPNNHPAQESRTLTAVTLPGVSIVSNSAISGGLLVKVPSYSGMAVGDKVTVTSYINGFDGTDGTPRGNTYSNPVITVVATGAFTVSVPQSALAGYGSYGGENGSYECEYSVLKTTGQVLYSKYSPYIADTGSV